MLTDYKYTKIIAKVYRNEKDLSFEEEKINNLATESKVNLKRKCSFNKQLKTKQTDIKKIYRTLYLARIVVN